MLEEGSFHGKTADFCWMLFLFAISLLGIGPILDMPFLSSALTFTIVYVWARRHPDVQMSFLGMFTFSAPYLPFVLIAFNALMYSSLPAGNLAAIALGHTYYFLEDVWPNQPSSGGRRWLATPQFILRQFEARPNPDDLLPRPHQD